MQTVRLDLVGHIIWIMTGVAGIALVHPYIVPVVAIAWTFCYLTRTNWFGVT